MDKNTAFTPLRLNHHTNYFYCAVTFVFLLRITSKSLFIPAVYDRI